jgi:hypothetical protein
VIRSGGGRLAAEARLSRVDGLEVHAADPVTKAGSNRDGTPWQVSTVSRARVDRLWKTAGERMLGEKDSPPRRCDRPA